MVSLQFGTMKNKNTFDNEPRNIASFQFYTILEGECKEKVISTVQQHFYFPSFSFMTFLLIFIFPSFFCNFEQIMEEKRHKKLVNYRKFHAFCNHTKYMHSINCKRRRRDNTIPVPCDTYADRRKNKSTNVFCLNISEITE